MCAVNSVTQPNSIYFPLDGFMLTLYGLPVRLGVKSPTIISLDYFQESITLPL